LEKEKKERAMRKREEIDRKLNEALLHAMVPKKVRCGVVRCVTPWVRSAHVLSCRRVTGVFL
jgi:hypothetical protein